MRIGFDVDGVLANFFQAYEKLTVEVTGKDLFGDKKWPKQLPQTWNWPETFGYTNAEMQEVWKHIKNSSSFWEKLWCMVEEEDCQRIHDLGLKHELYFITDRPGIQPQKQTREWLEWFNMPGSVIISGPHARKGRICHGLNLDYYVDDKYENIIDVLTVSPTTQTFMIKYPYNSEMIGGVPMHEHVHMSRGKIINSVEDFIGIIERT
jgi:hypothetical protein